MARFCSLSARANSNLGQIAERSLAVDCIASNPAALDSTEHHCVKFTGLQHIARLDLPSPVFGITVL